jgi:serine/threonine protein kinase/Tfp pilus assembly protein PilF
MIKQSIRNYNIIDRLGSGGTADVFLAVEQDRQRKRALKFHRPGGVEVCQFLSLIKREYDLLHQHTYPGILQPIDLIDTDTKRPFLVLEFCPDMTLDKVRHIENLEILFNIISSIAINLYYLKQVQISHGDLKPHNIFLTSDLKNYRQSRLLYTKISDFSLALKDDEKYGQRLGLGTIGYSAPETVAKDILNHRSDIFSLGVIAYYLATGIHPFAERESDPVRINANIKELDPPPPHEINPTLPEKLSPLILSWLAKNPEQRPADSYQICQQLEKLGCSYNYKKAIRPKYLLAASETANTDKLFNDGACDFDPEEVQRLLDYAGRDKATLRNILEINFTAGILGWHEGRLKVLDKQKPLIRPRRLRQSVIRSFHELKHSAKKRLARIAVCDDFEKAARIGVEEPSTGREAYHRPYVYYLKKHLSPVTVKRLAGGLAEKALNEYNDSVMAGRLYLKAGNIDQGYGVIIDAAHQLISDNSSGAAITMLRQFETLCDDTKNLDKRRKILMLLGDTQKDIGEATAAEKTYWEIITTYDERQPDRLLAETYKDLGDIYKIKHDYEKGIDALEKAEQLYSRFDDQLELSHTLNNKGTIYTINSQLDKALQTFRAALKLQRSLKVAADTASTLNNLAAIYYYKGRLNRTLRIFNIALKIQRETANSGEIARTLNNLGVLYNELGENDEAQESLEESLKLNGKIGSKKELLFNYENLAAVMLASGKPKEALPLLKKGIALAGELEDKPHLAIFSGLTGTILKRMGYYGQARSNYKTALVRLQEIDDDFQNVHCHIELADLHVRLNNPVRAENYLDRVHALIEKIDDKKSLVLEQAIRGEIKNNIDHLNQAVATAKQINAYRYEIVARLRLARLLARNSRWDRFREVIASLSDKFLSEKSDIEKAHYFDLIARHSFVENDLNNAEQYYKMAEDHAITAGLMPELITTYTGLGRTYVKSREYEKGYLYYRKALDTLKIIAGDINNEALSKLYLSHTEITVIMQEIKKLGEIMNGEKKAGP